MTRSSQRRRRAATAAVLTAVAAVAVCCGEKDGAGTAVQPQLVPDDALAGLLLSVKEIKSAMDGAPLLPQTVDSAMDDNRNMLPNLNCLGVWHPGESAIYGEQNAAGGWTSVRKQLFRTAIGDQWRSSVVQSITSYPNVGDAQAFLDQSADRWSKCTNHNVNITLNDQKLPHWRSGELVRTSDRLGIPISRSDGRTAGSCEHVLSRVSNLIIDVEACVPRNVAAKQAGVIATRIASNVPTAG